jgi:hypothetical protein
LIQILDPFGDDIHVERLRQIENRLDDCTASRIESYPIDE